MDTSEILDLKLNKTCESTKHPHRLQKATGVFIDNNIIICGGSYSSGSSNKCYQQNGTGFYQMTPMMEKRTRASSTVTNNLMWVTGGDGHKYYSSTEFIIPKDSNPFPLNSIPLHDIDLPISVRGHVILSLNSTTSILIGGQTVKKGANSHKCYYFNHINQNWTRGYDLMEGRRYHTAGLIKDHETHEEHIVVVGGLNDNGGSIKPSVSVEIMFAGERSWTIGTKSNHQ